MTQHAQEYTAAGDYTFNVPTGVSCLFASGIAGGGGGGVSVRSFIFSGQSAGAGGAGESCDNVLVKVTSGGTLAVHVGAGGVSGSISVLGVNVHAGPPGNNAFGAGFGGDDTIIGPIRLVGGYGGLTEGTSPHAGMGGGWRAFKGPGSGHTAGVANNGQYTGAAQAGFWETLPNAPRHFSGPGGGTGGGAPAIAGANGGDLGPFPGGVAPAAGTADSGGGGGASTYGAGGAGGDGSDSASSNAPAVPAASYGCGGGGAGGTLAAGATANKYNGAAGHDGYVLLTWFEP